MCVGNFFASSSQLKAPYHCSSKPCIIRGRSLQKENNKRTDLLDVFIVLFFQGLFWRDELWYKIVFNFKR